MEKRRHDEARRARQDGGRIPGKRHRGFMWPVSHELSGRGIWTPQNTVHARSGCSWALWAESRRRPWHVRVWLGTGRACRKTRTRFWGRPGAEAPLPGVYGAGLEPWCARLGLVWRPKFAGKQCRVQRTCEFGIQTIIVFGATTIFYWPVGCFNSWQRQTLCTQWPITARGSRISQTWTALHVMCTDLCCFSGIIFRSERSFSEGVEPRARAILGSRFVGQGSQLGSMNTWWICFCRPGMLRKSAAPWKLCPGLEPAALACTIPLGCQARLL